MNLEDGLVIDHIIECPTHNDQFDYRTGKAVRSPACEDLNVYKFKIENSTIFIDIDS